jgi:3-hydroxyisobutyrate dehydrogenase-like beta-hydroxyacid dehydrogenase
MRVGMIGLGNIGGHIATNLVADGHEVTVYDVEAARVAAVEGAQAADSVAAVGNAGEITMLSLPSPEVVRRVADEWASAAPAGSILVDLSTNNPTVVRELGARLERSGHHLVEAPLTGGSPGAEHRLLMFMVGGDDDAVARVRPVLEPLGRATFHLGPLGLGNTMKLVNSLLAYAATWASLEGLSLCAKAGIPVQRAVEVLRTGGTTNFFLDRMVEGIDQRDRPTSFALELAAKDMGLIVDTGRSLAVPTPAGSALLQVLVGAVAAGLGDHDWSDLVTAAERQGDVRLRWNAD